MSDVVERKIGDLTVRIDRETCISTENCVEVGPGLFGLDDESICSFLPVAGAIDREGVIEACQICPVDALIVLDEDGTQIVP